MPQPSVAQAVEFRALQASDAAACHALSQEVKWPHRLSDWQVVIGLGQGIAAVLDGKIVATALWWPYGPNHATLGMIIVSPTLQKAGIGKRLMAALFEQTGGRALMLNATAAGEPLYRQLGFGVRGQIHQHQGIATPGEQPEPLAGARLRLGGVEDLATLLHLDQTATGLRRDDLLRTLLSIGSVVILERDMAPAGYAIVRPFGRGSVIGPVVADDADGAKLLIAYWLSRYRMEFIRIDTNANWELSSWLAAQGLPQTGKAITMTKGDMPEAVAQIQLFAISNQALG